MKVVVLLVALFSFPLVVFATELLNPIELKNHKEIEEPTPLKFSSDSAELLNMHPSISLQSGGGISSSPVIQGLGDDRVKIKIDGATITSSCSNHMNPALSYIDPGKISKISVLAGITPVSQGGDSIGGSIIVESKEPSFSNDSDSVYQLLNLKSYFKSNNENQGIVLNLGISNQDLSFLYSGVDDRANNYRSGNGRRLKATLFNQNNQMVTIGKKISSGVVTLKLSRANVPYQGFVNQYMDLEDNVASFGSLNYQGKLGEIGIVGSLFYQHTNHYMNKIRSQRKGNMPMYTRSDEFGYNLKGELELNKYSNLIFGSEFVQYSLDDWWTAVEGMSPVMGPGTFESIKNGRRERIALFIEVDSNWSSRLSTNFGLRTDMVSMNTGNVNGYSSANLQTDADVFNSRSRRKVDTNIDSTLSAKRKLTSQFDIEFGVARKTRSPNLYERYAWAGSTTSPGASGPVRMDMRMINWFGDGNGYVGDIDLKPEIAYKISTSFIFHDKFSSNWEIKLTPYASEVTDFVDADLLAVDAVNTHYLKFANHDAVIFGSDLSIEKKFLSSNKIGDFSLRTIASYTRGYRKDGKANLYHLMPLNAKVFLIHEVGKWTSDLKTNFIHNKEVTNSMRREKKSAGHVSFDIGSSYLMSKMFKLDFGISNLFDKQYYLPLGGVDLVNSQTDTSLAGMGRSYNIALTIEYF